MSKRFLLTAALAAGFGLVLWRWFALPAWKLASTAAAAAEHEDHSGEARILRAFR